jgi:hypothetical protein
MSLKVQPGWSRYLQEQAAEKSIIFQTEVLVTFLKKVKIDLKSNSKSNRTLLKKISIFISIIL